MKRTLSTANTTLIKPSTFTGKAEFYETLFFLDDVLIKLGDIPSNTQSQSSFTWLSRNQMQDKLGFTMSLLEYRQIRQRLNKIAPAADVSPNIIEFLRIFANNHSNSNNNKDESSKSHDSIDQYGRVSQIGRRKSAVAKVTIIPTLLGKESECLVNGRLASEYFLRLRDMYKLAEPLRVVGQIGKFNIWAIGRGGGPTGQAGAIQLGLARALSIYNPEWKEALETAGLLKRDIRRVERKKPGQEKARKKFTWVKR